MTCMSVALMHERMDENSPDESIERHRKFVLLEKTEGRGGREGGREIPNFMDLDPTFL